MRLHLLAALLGWIVFDQLGCVPGCRAQDPPRPAVPPQDMLADRVTKLEKTVGDVNRRLLSVEQKLDALAARTDGRAELAPNTLAPPPATPTSGPRRAGGQTVYRQVCEGGVCKLVPVTGPGEPIVLGTGSMPTLACGPGGCGPTAVTGSILTYGGQPPTFGGCAGGACGTLAVDYLPPGAVYGGSGAAFGGGFDASPVFLAPAPRRGLFGGRRTAGRLLGGGCTSCGQ